MGWFGAVVLLLCFLGSLFLNWYQISSGDSVLWGVSGIEGLQALLTGKAPDNPRYCDAGPVARATGESAALVVAGAIAGLAAFALCMGESRLCAASLWLTTILFTLAPLWFIYRIASTLGPEYLYKEAMGVQTGIGGGFITACIAALASWILTLTSLPETREHTSINIEESDAWKEEWR